MAKYLLLGLFHEATPTADTLDQLRQLGVPDEEITVMSGIPYRAEMLGRPRRRGRGRNPHRADAVGERLG